MFDVDDARWLVALQYHFLITCGQHIVRKCSFCVTTTRALARYNVGKECPRQSVRTSKDGDRRSILTHEHVVCGELRHVARTRLVVGAFFILGTYAMSAPCCSTSTSLGDTGTFPGLAGCASAASAVSCSKPINTLTPPVSDFIFALVSALSRYTPPARSNSMRFPVNSLSVVPPVLRNVMMLPLSHIRPTDMIHLCSARDVDTVSRAQANRRVAGRCELMSSG